MKQGLFLYLDLGRRTNVEGKGKRKQLWGDGFWAKEADKPKACTLRAGLCVGTG